MKHDSSITEAVFKSILEHFWYARDHGLPKQLRIIYLTKAGRSHSITSWTA
jgi:hypothetical protein